MLQDLEAVRTEVLTLRLQNLQPGLRLEPIPTYEARLAVTPSSPEHNPDLRLHSETPIRSKTVGTLNPEEWSRSRYQTSPSIGYGPFVAGRRLVFELENTPLSPEPRLEIHTDQAAKY